MLFYFSGTGNSEFVATTLSNIFDLELRYIPDINPKDLSEVNERIIFVFPVYSWGVPPLVIDFIERLPAKYVGNVNESSYTLDCVMTCGDEVALAPEMFSKACSKVGLKVNSIWSVIMPNNYVLLPGFNVDSKELETRKLTECKGRILEIAEGLRSGNKRIDVTIGSMPWIKTKLIYPLFKKWGVFPRKWRYTSQCISCGKCASVCPLYNIKMQDTHPVWGPRCCSCLACYHVCPVHAVAYGNVTLKKGQYFFPLRKISSRRCHKR